MKVFVETILVLTLGLFVLTCAPSGPRDIKSAQTAAINSLRHLLEVDYIDIDLFNGPILVGVDSVKYKFQWKSKTPKPGATIIEVSVPRNPAGDPGIRIKGERDRTGYLFGTLDFPINEAALYNLFSLPPNPKDTTSDRARRLRMVPLDSEQLEDVANFVEISRDLHEYAFCLNGKYPDNLDELNNFKNRGYFAVFKLDSIYVHDRYGQKYYYENIIDFVALGTPGKNGIWDFKKDVFENLYNDRKEHIFINGDDILVKLKYCR